MPDNIIQISVFGALDFRVDGQLLDLSISGATRSLLQYLICSRERLSRREKLMETFWPDTRPERRRSSLNSAIWRIKKALKHCPHIRLNATAECVGLTGLLSDNVCVDFIRLEQAIDDLV